MKQRKETGAMATMRNPAEENFDETPAEALDHASRDSTSDDEGRGRAAGRAHKEEAKERVDEPAFKDDVASPGSGKNDIED